MKRATWHTRKAWASMVAVTLAALTVWQLPARAQEHKTPPPAPQQAAPTSSKQAASKPADSSPTGQVIQGIGTVNTIPLFIHSHVIGNSLVTQTGNGVSVNGSVSAVSFTGDGSAVTNVNAATLSGLGSSSFAQTGFSNTFTADQTIDGNLNLTGMIGNLTDSLGEYGANVIGGFGGNASFPGNSIAAGVIGATIGGGGGAYESSSAPQRLGRPAPGAQARPTPGAQTRFRPGEKRAQQPSQEAQPAEPAGVTESGVTSGSNAVLFGGNWGTIAGGYSNTASGPGAAVGGGFANTASGANATVAGGALNTASNGYATVGGGESNTASGSQSTVGGGTSNSATLDDATVAGGVVNLASAQDSTVGGGCGNMASGIEATVGGGGGAIDCTSSQGDGNIASGHGSTVSGGTANTASGDSSTVPGGTGNQALGGGSFAAGCSAVANYYGSFVWGACSSLSPTTDTAANQFVAAAPGGFFFYTDNSGDGATLPAGSGSWSSLSDRNAKTNFSPVNAPALLEKLAALPLSTWNYKSQADSIHHLGPTAQDFHAAFGLGEDDKHISTVDSEGVALAAIQALYTEFKRSLDDRDREISELRERLNRLEQAGGSR